MNIVNALVLGVLQGLTEFLPVSSTAHMAIIPQLLGWRDPGATFSAIVQLGPIVAIIACFWGDLVKYAKGIVRTKSPANTKEDTDGRLGWFALIGTIPLCIAGYLLESKIDTTFRTFLFMGTALILLALVMLVAELVGKRTRGLSAITWTDTAIIGVAQILALVPGASRSGVTITAGLFRDLDRETATQFSFLLAIPAITLAGLYKIYKLSKVPGGFGHELGNYLLAAAVAGIVAFIVVKLFLKLMEKGNTYWFIGYRIVLGAVILGLLFSHKIVDRPKEVDPSIPGSIATQATPPAG